MKMHPKDTAIQEYALQTGKTHEHIDHCEQCLERVRQYRLLFTSLGRQKENEVPVGLADAVMVRITEITVHQNREWKLVLIAVSLSVAAGISIPIILLELVKGYLQIEGIICALLGIGGAGLAIFLVSIQWQHYYKVTQSIKINKILQPK